MYLQMILFYLNFFYITDFKNETFIVLSLMLLPHLKTSSLNGVKKNGFNPKKIKYVPNVESQMLSVEVGLGITIAGSLSGLHNNPLLKSIELNTSHHIYIV